MPNDAKVAFITGANRGIGLEVARELAQTGATVLLGSRDCAKGEAAITLIRQQNVSDVQSVQFDALNAADHQRVAKLLMDRFGRLDILINNAGIALKEVPSGSSGGFNTTSVVSEEVLRETFDTNFFAIVALTQTLLPLLRRSPAGRVVNVSSSLASLTLHSDPSSTIYRAKPFAYAASKTALNAFTVHLAAELRTTKVKVNSAHPGWVQTAIGGPAAPLSAREGSKTIVQLALLPDDGPTGGYFYLEERLPW